MRRIREWLQIILDYFTPIPNPVTGENGPSAFSNMLGRIGGKISDGWQGLTSGRRRQDHISEEEHPIRRAAPRTSTLSDESSQVHRPFYDSGDVDRETAYSTKPKRSQTIKSQSHGEGASNRGVNSRPAPLAGRAKKDELTEEMNERKPRLLPREPMAPPTENPLFIFRSRPKPRNFILSVVVTTLKLLLIFILVVGFSGMGFGLGIAQAYVATTPDLDITRIEDQNETSFIYDKSGNLITQYTGVENRIWATADEIPKNMLNAIVAIEDARFYSHNGVDIKRIVGSLFSNMRSSTTQGASTITCQLIKMRILSSEQTYKRKLQEAYLAIELEKEYSKKDILVAYLNTINLAQTNYGVKAAAKDYFGKDLSQLTLRECAMLAGCAQAPYTYDPRSNYYTRNTPEVVNKRTDMVLAAMYKNNYITKDDYEAALKDQVNILQQSPTKEQYDYPYFVEYAIEDVITHLLRDRELPDNDTNRSQVEAEIRTSGYSIYTTMDPTIQTDVQDSLYNWNKYPKTKNADDSTLTVKNADGSSIVLDQPQAAATVVDAHSGYVVAVVGGRQEPTTKRGLNRAYQSHMPVGSSIKPIAVYGPAIDQGASPGSIIADMPIPISGWGGRGYPNNSGSTFHGAIPLREGVVNSYNVVAARVLADYVGYDTSVSYLRALGVTSEINQDGPGLALGTSGLTVMEMAGAYTALANGGVYVEPVTFTKIVDSKGNVVLDSSQTQIRRQVFKESTAWLVTDILTDAVKRGTGTAARLDNMTTAGKTGTNSENRGVFFTGYTPYYVSAIWVGHDNYKALSSTSGGKGAAPIFKDYMTKIHEGLENKPINTKTAEEVGLKKVTVCAVSGMLATPACAKDAAGAGTVTDYFTEDSAPTCRCTMHQTLVYCKESGKLATPYCPAEDLEERAAVIIPENSIYRQLSSSKLMEMFPNAILDYPEDGVMPYDDPKYADYYCPIHTKEWADQQSSLTSLISSSQTLINQVQTLMEQTTLSQTATDQLNGAMADLANACNNSKDPATIQTAYNKLLTLKEFYLPGN